MINKLDDRDALDRALKEPRAVIYKHSPICWQSTIASRQVTRFADDHQSLPVYRLDVLAHAELARRVATTLGVPHESPQAIVVTDGKAVWSASHFGVRARAIRKAINGTQR